MKNKSTLMMIEIVIMIFVFSLASAVCLKIFTESNFVSQESLILDRASVIAQNTAELLKASRGNTEYVNEYISNNLTDDEYTVEISKNENEQKYLGTAKVSVKYMDDEVFSVTASWQEVSDYE